ncbi:MAG: adenylate/guanylate cyclase domain-containing protein [Myxococcales bacterium]|nr:adenylate/guanylate cyclase domain-containing protein [Myxococcales bacterium]
MAGEDQLQLFVEEICCDLCRFIHIVDDDLASDDVQVRREVAIGPPGAFADIHVRATGRPAYFVEIKIGYPEDRLVRQLLRKYDEEASADPRTPTIDAERLVLLTRPEDYADWASLVATLEAGLRPGLTLEVWDEAHFLRLLRERFGIAVETLKGADLEKVRTAVEEAKWRLVFGDTEADGALRSSLLWHFSPWALHRLHAHQGLAPHEILRPGLYRGLAVVLADLCAFSSYVRDTRDDALIRRCLATFYSQARHTIHNCGGMLYQFVGDEVVGVFGYPFGVGDAVDRALACARALLDVGTSVSHHWQREIDRVQRSAGVHVGMALGDLNLVPLRPYSTAHHGFVGDGLNIAARLMSAASCGQIVCSNTFFNRLPAAERAHFAAVDALEAKNIGMISCWRAAGHEPTSSTDAFEAIAVADNSRALPKAKRWGQR